jgi:hypothetical protein
MPGFKLPNEATPSVELDPNTTYIGTLLGFEERPQKPFPGTPQRFDAEGNLVQETTIVWKFNLTDPDTGLAVTRLDGAPYEQWGWSGTNTFFDPTGQKRNGKAREWFHAMAGRVLSDDEVISLLNADESGTPVAFIGRKAMVDVVANTNGYKVDRLRPYKAKAKAQAAPAPAADVPSAMGRQARKTRVEAAPPTTVTTDLPDQDEVAEDQVAF